MLLKKFIVFLLFVPVVALSQQAQIDLRHRPPEMIITDNKFSGPIVVIIDQLLSSIDVVPLWIDVPWPRTLRRAKSGKVDIVPRHSITSDRENFLLPMLLGYEDGTVYYLLGPHINKAEQYHELEQLNKLNFGLLRDSYYGPHVDSFTSKTTTFANDIDQLMGMLLAKRIDVMPVKNLVWAERSYAKIKNKYNNLQYHLAEVNESFYHGKYISIPKQSKLRDKYHQLNCLLYQWRKSGKIDEIYMQHQALPYIQTFDDAGSKKQAMSCNKTIIK